ncbi:hypothetical protein BO94DRAFT_539551 [Aspergillus sclerotioniger CBS 115572]|uniref:Mid2 domain-containing protein n=1 Tax=Aspergillus sclerotioniger CBS 115572 TaxID=1450535 RepID=A0A317VES3_9EURO|nr:hypothetical protein BO94DRAFT_539551 [Aspergillus sclerotioniger CBS 115572]PWY71597.1 hypothetical protein BO94DRAFT_539551 [Aspergillus sclerotioniger CBS 115572]
MLVARARMAAFALMATPAMMQTTTAPTTTYIKVFEENIVFYSHFFSELVGSIVNVDTDQDQTTIAINCIQSLLANCSTRSLGMPPTFTMGPSTFIYSWSSTRHNSQAYTIDVQAEGCKIFSSTESASCWLYASYWHSDNATSTSTSVTENVTMNSADITYDTLMVTAGVEKLLAPATTTQNQDGTGTASTVTASVSTATFSSRSSSKTHPPSAWIAGPVMGAMIGCALIAAGVYWCLRRRKQKDPMTTAETAIQPPSEEMDASGSILKTPPEADMTAEAQGTPLAELPAHNSSWPRELA